MLTTKYVQVVDILGEPADKFERDEWDVAAAHNVSYTFAWWQPVFTRKLENCVYGDPIGCIDQVLLNRLESNTDYIARRLYEVNIKQGNRQPVDTVWQRQMYLFYADTLRIRKNIMAVRNSGIIDPSTPAPEILQSGGMPLYTVINDWEKCLFDIKQLLDGGEMNLIRRLGTFALSTNFYHQLIRR